MSRGGIGLALATAMLGGGLASSAQAQDDGLKTVRLQVDGRKAKKRADDASLTALTSLDAFDLVCLNATVVMDGSQRGVALASTTGDVNRYPVACRPGRMGDYPMGSGVEYLLPGLGTVGQQTINLLVFPGSPSEHHYNSVSCVADPTDKGVAIFRIRGFFTVDSKDLADVREIDLRPASYGKEAAITRQAAAACLK